MYCRSLSLDLRFCSKAGVESMNAATFCQNNIKTRFFRLHEQTSPTSVHLQKMYKITFYKGWVRNGNNIETKANESFDNGVFFNIDTKRTPSLVSKLFSKRSEHI